MRRVPRSCIALAVLGLTTVLACGETTPVEPDPVATSITASAGDGQTATTSTALPTALTVTILDDAGAAFSGATVAWTVVSGGGSLSESESTTGADGTASTTWTLGQTAGVQTARAASGSLAIDFTATAEAGPFMPTADVMISGEMDVTTFTIPDGVTVTAEDDVVINATETFVVDGSLVADCMGVEVNAVGELTVTGTVQNLCDSTMVDGAPDLVFHTSGAITFDGAMIESTGGITISNVGLSPVEGRSGSPRNHLGLDCNFIATGTAVEVYGAHGAAGTPMGGNGADGSDVTLLCAGDAIFEGGVFKGQVGGNGGTGTSSGSEPAVGGKGGRGGDIVVESNENVIFRDSAEGDPVTFLIARGGIGGNAVAEGETPVAQGGQGGRVGIPRVVAAGSITVESGGALVIEARSSAHAGEGGTAEAHGMAGADATGGSPAQPGADATATGGRGGAFGLETGLTELIGDMLDGETVTNPEHVTVTIVNPEMTAGRGGLGVADPGDGGNGDAMNPDGAAQGMFTARGGDGGDVTLFDNRENGGYLGVAGDGGNAFFGSDNEQAGGGAGFDMCSEEGNAPGGAGGPGGDLLGGGGLGGNTGPDRTGETGTLFMFNAANGGNGGAGEGPGAGGAAGTEQLLVGMQEMVENSFMAGAAGNDCPGAQPPFTSFQAAQAEAIARVAHASLILFAVAKQSGALAATANGELLADLVTAVATTMYGVAGLGDATGQFLVFGLTGIYANTAALPAEVPPGVSGLEGGPARAPADITLERASLSVTGVTDNDGNTTDGVMFGNDPNADGAVFAQNGDNNVLIVVKDGSGMPIVDPATANVFKPGGTSIFGDDRVVSAFAGDNGFTASDPILVVTEAADGTGKLWRVDLVGGAAVPTEETDVFVWAGPRRVRCIMPEGVCAVSSFGAGFSLGGTTLFTWDGGSNVEQVPGFSGRAGAYLGIDLVPWGSDIGMVLPGFNGNDYTVDRLDASTGEIIETNTYAAPAGCNPGHAMFRPRTDGGSPTEVLLSCNGTGEVVSVPVTGPMS